METRLEKLLVVSADFRQAPIELRERLAFGDGADPHPAALLAAKPGIHEAVWLESCDRVEAMLLAESESEALDGLADLWWRHARVEMAPAWRSCSMYRGAGAIEHLAGLLCGVGIAFPGSLHVRAEFREAQRASWESGGMGAGLRRMCQLASEIAEHVRPDPGATPAVRVMLGGEAWPEAPAAQAALAIAQEQFAPLEGRNAMILGAGRLATAIGAALREAGVNVAMADICGVAARAAAARLGARWVPLGLMLAEGQHSEIFVAAAAGRRHIRIPAGAVGTGHGLRTRLMLDLGFPRSIDPQVRSLGIQLYDLDQAAEHARAKAGEKELQDLQTAINREVELALWPENKIPAPLAPSPAAAPLAA